MQEYTISSNESIPDALDLLEQAAKEKADEINRQVYANPWPCIGSTALIALLFGYILARNNRT